MDVMSAYGLLGGISDYTSIEALKTKKKTVVTKSCIDHIFVRSRKRDAFTAALGTKLADHDHRVTTHACN